MNRSIPGLIPGSIHRIHRALVECQGERCNKMWCAGTQGSTGRMTLAHVLFVADLFHPLNRFALELFLNGDMGHRRGWSGAVPMLLARGNPDDVTRPNLLDRASPALCAATASRHDQSLPQRVGVPCRPSAGLEGDTSTESARRRRRIE